MQRDWIDDKQDPQGSVAVKQAQKLAARMGFHQDPDFGPVIDMFPGQMPLDVSVQQKPAKAPFLHLNAQGREIDEHRNVINMPKLTNLSTLKVRAHCHCRHTNFTCTKHVNMACILEVVLYWFYCVPLPSK